VTFCPGVVATAAGTALYDDRLIGAIDPQST
jgi:hypothetical protein